MNTKIPIILIVILFTGKTVLGQNEDYTHYSSWNTFTVKANVSKKLFIKNEFNFRRTNFLQDWEQIVLRPSVQYKLDNSLTVAVGYSYIQNYNYSDIFAMLDTKESNIWQQLFISQSFTHFGISHRIRFEERFKENVAIVDGIPVIAGTGYSGRLRYRFIIAIPLLKKHNISAEIYDEVFLDFKQDLQPTNLDQNWMFIGLRFRKSEHITIKSGYHNINIPRQDSTITNHVWETTLIYSI